ncbi:MAG: C25 family peptidase propeptide domain-containing protein [candidate division WOR-3 bacterium]
MKLHNKVLMAFAILALRVLPLQAFGPFEVALYRGEYRFVQERGFTRITPQTPAPLNTIRPGFPELPAKYLRYIIPLETKPDSLNILELETYNLSGTFLIYPTQPTVPLCSIPPWVPPDSLIYRSTSPFPAKVAEVVSVGNLDNAKIVTVAVYPFRYIPAARRLVFTNRVRFDLTLSPDPTPGFRRVRTASCQRYYDGLLSTVIENDPDIPLYYLRPEDPKRCPMMTQPGLSRPARSRLLRRSQSSHPIT